jgi:hypothetical protein
VMIGGPPSWQSTRCSRCLGQTDPSYNEYPAANRHIGGRGARIAMRRREAVFRETIGESYGSWTNFPVRVLAHHF